MQCSATTETEWHILVAVHGYTARSVLLIAWRVGRGDIVVDNAHVALRDPAFVGQDPAPVSGTSPTKVVTCLHNFSVDLPSSFRCSEFEGMREWGGGHLRDSSPPRLPMRRAPMEEM